MKSKMAAAALALGLWTGAEAKVYDIDPSHSQVSFRVAHMMVGKVSGSFGKFSGEVRYEKGKPKTWGAEASIEAASVDTRLPDRDKHLRDADFFDAVNHPLITFKSAAVESRGKKTRLIGDLTMRGVTKRVVLDLEVSGVAKDPWGNERLGAVATGKLSRKDFGLTWNKALEAGGVAVGDEVTIVLEIEGVARKS